MEKEKGNGDCNFYCSLSDSSPRGFLQETKGDEMTESEFYVIMLKRKDGQVYADLAKSSETIYLTREEAERALNEEFVIDGHTASQWHVVRLLARLPEEGDDDD